MNIVIICHYFHPEIGAPSARLYEMAKHWVREGHQVQVVTCFPNHPTGIIPEKYRGKRYIEETVDGIKVHRNFVYATPNKGFLKKTLGHISFMFSSVLFSINKIERPDLIITSSPTFFSIYSGLFFRRVKKVPFVLEIRDLWPAAIVELGVLKNKLIIKILEKIELGFYRKSNSLVMVTNSFKQNLINRGIPEEKIEVLTNGYEEELYFKREEDIELSKEYKIGNKFVVEYVGAHGISQALDKIILVADKLKSYPDIVFLFVGEGAEKDKLQEMTDNLKLNNIIFVDSQPKKEIPRFYSVADVCLISLKKIDLFQTFIPSKMFEIMGCGVPLVASVEGEAAEILKESGAAIVTGCEDVEAIAGAILKLKNSPSLSLEMAKSGMEFVKQRYSRRIIAENYIHVLEKTIKEYKK